MPSAPNLPDSYYIGQEFVEDPDTVTTTIQVLFYSPALIQPFDFFAKKTKVSVGQKDGWLVCSFPQEISKKLIADVEARKQRATQFIVGYVTRYLPRINYELLRLRYTSGHLLVRTYSTLDAYGIRIIPAGATMPVPVEWPPTVRAFPPASALAASNDAVHIHDFIDATNAYFTGAYDDSIRKAITSVENAFRAYDLTAPQRRWWQAILARLTGNRGSFRSIVNRRVRADDLGRTVIADNLIYLYGLRNKIVHEHFRLRPENGWICKKAIGTVQYLHQWLARDADTRSYVMRLAQQFLLLDTVASGQDLDRIARRVRTEARSPLPTITTPRDVDKFMFEGLRITKEAWRLVLKNKVHRNFYP